MMGIGNGLQFTVGLDMRKAERDLMEFRGKADSIGQSLGSLKSVGLAVGAAVGAGLVAGAAALKTFLDAGAEMEAFESRLTTLMGSSVDARARLQELFAFAAKTPFEVPQIVAAETTLRGFGAAAEELMPGLIDFAATMGTDLSQAAIDFGKAWNQGATGLESDAGRVLRKQIELRTGLDATTMSLGDFRAAMLDTLNEGMFAGGADKLSATMSGMISNLTDEWGRFKMEVADAGVFDNVKAVLQATLGYISDHRVQVERLASLVSGGLWSAFKGVAYVIAGMVDLGNALGVAFLTVDSVLTRVLGGARERLGRLQLDMGAMAKAAGMDGLAGQFDAMGNKMLLVAAAEKQASVDAEHLAGEMLSVGSAVSAVNQIFADAEQVAAGFGEEIAGIKAPPELTGKGGGGGDKKGKAGKSTLEQEQDDFWARLEASQSFYDEMAALGRDALQEEQAQYAERMSTLLAYHDEGLLVGEAFARARLAIEEDYTAAVDAMRDEEAARDLERRQNYNRTMIDGTTALLGTLEGLAQASGEKQKNLAKSLAIAQIAISTAVGISKAFEQFGWPAGLAPAALVAANGVAQGIAVAQAHQGRAGTERTYAHQGRAPDERDLRVLQTESTLNSQATRALGVQGIEALNSGRMPTGEIVVNLGRTQTREVMREELRSGETLTRRYVGGLVGSGNRDSGFSGARAVA